ncbi:Modification methylase AplI [compost metagenome]
MRLIPPGGNYQDVPDEYATQRILNFKRTGGRTSTYGRLHPLRPAFTVNTYFRRPNVGANFHPFEDRLITVREAMRLQSLPDWFEIAQMGAQDARNALVGNAVPPLMAQAVAREVLNSIGVTPAVAQLAS